MLFNSFEFAIFLPIVFLLYWFVFDYALSKYKHQLLLQNLFIIIASYVFYGWWDWRFLLLIAITTLLSFLSGICIERTPTQTAKKAVMIANVVINLGILGVYKYYDFFAVQFAQLFGIQSDFMLLHLILPVGISFYTFQALSYSIDVYRKNIHATHDIVSFTAFLSFFPQLVAGPIERATNLLPQFQKRRHFDYAQAVDGMRQILWGLFKKIVIADNCAIFVDQVFGNIAGYSGSTLILAAVLFTFQIYGDFSGYSDIAIGTAKLFGIKLMRNFNVPYFSRDIAEFWRRWHISLTTWFRDYVYIPLGGSRPALPVRLQSQSERSKEGYKKAIVIRNTFIIFLLSGFWHGANWTFVLWGAYHALLFVPLLLLGKNRRYRDSVATISLENGQTKAKWLPSLKECCQMLLTFALVVFGWIIFRANDITHFEKIMSAICSHTLFLPPWIKSGEYIIPLAINILILLVFEWINRTQEYGLKKLPNSAILRMLIYFGLFLLMFFYTGKNETFIYFQF